MQGLRSGINSMNGQYRYCREGFQSTCQAHWEIELDYIALEPKICRTVEYSSTPGVSAVRHQVILSHGKREIPNQVVEKQYWTRWFCVLFGDPISCVRLCIQNLDLYIVYKEDRDFPYHTHTKISKRAMPIVPFASNVDSAHIVSCLSVRTDWIPDTQTFDRFSVVWACR